MKNFLKIALLGIILPVSALAGRNMPVDTIQPYLQGAAPSSPATGTVYNYFLSADGFPYWKNSAGSVLGYMYSSSALTTNGVLVGNGTRSPTALAACASSTFLAGVTGLDPVCRALLSADIPNNAANTSGNAATASAFDHTPSACAAGTYVTAQSAAGALTCSTPPGTGVTAITVASANGFTGSSSGGSTPALTIATSITGLLKGNGTAISAAVSGTDYQAAGNYITALTGDVTASGPGSVAATLATVNSDVGSFTSANITVDAKGRITAAANGSGGGGSSTVDNFIYVEGGNGHGSTNTKVRRYVRVKESVGSLITYADSAANGGSFTIATGGGGGFFACVGEFSSGASKVGVTVNGSALTTSVAAPLTYAQGLRSYTSSAVNATSATNCVPLLLADADVVRVQTTGSEDGTDQRVWFALTRMGAATDYLYLNSGNGHGSSNTRIRRYSSIIDAAEASTTIAQSSTAGDSVTINTDGQYIICYGDGGSGGGSTGITVDEVLGTTGSTSIASMSYSDGLRAFHSNGGNTTTAACFSDYLTNGRVIRVHTNAAPDFTDARSYLAILKVGSASRNHIYAQGHAGHGSVNTKYKYFTSTLSETVSSGGAYITKSTLTGDQFYINDPGLYLVCYSDSTSGASCDTGITVDGKLPTTTILSHNHGSGAYSMDDHGTANESSNTCIAKYLAHGQLVSPTDDGGTNAADNDASYFFITRFQ